MLDFEDAASSSGLEMKERHTIIEPWPLRVNGNLRPTRKDKDDFKLRLGSMHSGQERYVEWKVGATGNVPDLQEEGYPERQCMLS